MVKVIEVDDFLLGDYEDEEGDEGQGNYIPKYDRWVVEGNSFYPCAKTTPALPAGYYQISYNNNSGYSISLLSNVIKDKIIKLDEGYYKTIVDDVKTFWEREQVFKDFEYCFKRGLLLYGPPGSGKTYLLHQIGDYVIKKYDGIVIQTDDIINLTEFLPNVLSKIEKDRKVVVLLEDFDKLLDSKSGSKLLSLLDGQLQIENVVYIATTNDIDALDQNLQDRPSRFDRKHLIDFPSEIARKSFISAKIPSSYLQNIDIDMWVTQTKGFSFAHIKELIISNLILGNDFAESVTRLKDMKKNKKSYSNTSIGFGG